MSEAVQPQDAGFRRVRLRCECRAVLARLQRKDQGFVARFTRDLRAEFESDTKLRCTHCGRVHHLGRGGRGTDVILAALATGNADVYLDDIVPRAKAISLTE